MFLEQSPISLYVKSWTTYKNQLGLITEEEEESKQFHKETKKVSTEEEREGDYYLVELGQMEKEIEKQGAGIREIVWSAF